MALAEAILVCLTERPMTGYELTKAFDASIGFFWRARHQQIYRELQSLRSEGMVAAEEVVQSGKPNKTVYTLLPAGRARVRAWSGMLTERPASRDPMLVKLYALDAVDRPALLQEIESRLERHRSRLQTYERILARHYSTPPASTRQEGRLLGLKYGLMIEHGHIAWCEEALALLTQ